MAPFDTDVFSSPEVTVLWSELTAICRVEKVISRPCSADDRALSVVRPALREARGSEAIPTARLRTCCRLDANLLVPVKPGEETVTGDVIEEDIVYCLSTTLSTGRVLPAEPSSPGPVRPATPAATPAPWSDWPLPPPHPHRGFRPAPTNSS